MVELLNWCAPADWWTVGRVEAVLFLLALGTAAGWSAGVVGAPMAIQGYMAGARALLRRRWERGWNSAIRTLTDEEQRAVDDDMRRANEETADWHTSWTLTNDAETALHACGHATRVPPSYRSLPVEPLYCAGCDAEAPWLKDTAGFIPTFDGAIPFATALPRRGGFIST